MVFWGQVTQEADKRNINGPWPKLLLAGQSCCPEKLIQCSSAKKCCSLGSESFPIDVGEKKTLLTLQIKYFVS